MLKIIKLYETSSHEIIWLEILDGKRQDDYLVIYPETGEILLQTKNDRIVFWQDDEFPKPELITIIEAVRNDTLVGRYSMSLVDETISYKGLALYIKQNNITTGKQAVAYFRKLEKSLQRELKEEGFV